MVFYAQSAEVKKLVFKLLGLVCKLLKLNTTNIKREAIIIIASFLFLCLEGKIVHWSLVSFVLYCHHISFSIFCMIYENLKSVTGFKELLLWIGPCLWNLCKKRYNIKFSQTSCKARKGVCTPAEGVCMEEVIPKCLVIFRCPAKGSGGDSAVIISK